MTREARQCRGAFKRRLISLALLTACTFALLWAGNQFNNAGNAVTRYMANLQAPFTGWFYPDKASDDITVILYDDAFLQSQALTWPLSYSDQAAWIERLVSSGSTPPKAVFIDLSFGERHWDDSVTTLRDTLCEIRKTYGTSIYMAGLNGNNNRLYVRKELDPTLHPELQSCYTLIDASYTPDIIDNKAWSYPLFHQENGVTTRSAAAAIAEDVANIHGLSPSTGAPGVMALEWGTRSQPWPDNWDKPTGFKECGQFRDVAKTFLPWVSNHTKDGLVNLCPYHRTLSMQHVSTMDADDVSPFVAGKYLMIGAQLGGYNDFVYSPTNGIMPGVYLHAMALDNLLTYRARYKHNEEWSWLPGWDLFLTALTIIVITSLTRAMFRQIRQLLGKYGKNSALLQQLATSPAHMYALPSVWGRLLAVLIQSLIWLTVILAKVIAIMLLVVLAQKIFRLGMLPLIELTGMVVLAEAFDVTEKFKLLLSGQRTKAEQT